MRILQDSRPSKHYRELLGTALCVFNSNNSFIIENILRNDCENRFTWYQLIDMTSGGLLKPIRETISVIFDEEIYKVFDELVTDRNRIIHSFQIANENGEQILHTKDKMNRQYSISEKFLFDFIDKNQILSSMLHNIRGF